VATFRVFHYDDVTQGLRMIRDGERGRFLPDQAHPGNATYLIQLCLPHIQLYP
jgi:hypothetical protein